MNQTQDFSSNKITSLQLSLFKKSRHLIESTEQNKARENSVLEAGKKESVLLLEKTLQPIAFNSLGNANLLTILEQAAEQQFDNRREAANLSYEKAKKSADEYSQFFSRQSSKQQELVLQWSRINHSSLDISKDDVLAKNKPNTIEACQNLAAATLNDMDQIGDPSALGGGQLGRGFFGVIGDVLVGGGGAIAGVISLLVMGGIPAVIVSAVIALIISISMDVSFMSVLWTLVGIVGGIGVLIGLLGGFTSEEEKEKKLAQRKVLATGCQAYLIYQLTKEEMPKLYKERIPLLKAQKLDQYQQASESLQVMKNSIEKFKQAFSQAVKNYQKNLEQIEHDDVDGQKKLLSELLLIASLFPSTPAIMDWNHTDWLNKNPAEIFAKTPQNERRAPGAIRVGLAKYPGNIQSTVNTPLMIDISTCGHIFIITNRDTQKQADAILQSLVARLVFSTQIMSAKYIFIDPKSSGMFSMYRNLPERMGNYDYSSSEDIQEKIQELELHKKQVQGKIGDKSLSDYNQTALVPEMYRFLCVAGFPNENRFDRQTYQHLENIIENGNKVGIHIIMQISTDAEEYSRLPETLQIDQLSKHGAVITPDSKNWGLGINGETLDFTADDSPDYKIFHHLMPTIKVLGTEADVPTVDFGKISPAPNHWWTRQSKPLLDVQFGYAGETELRFRLGSNGVENFVHALVAGQSGSGKSVFFHTLINNIALNYSPDEVELYLLDFKQGVEFKPYADFHLPHARVIAIESEPEFGLSILNNLWNEHLRRTKMGMQKFEDFPQKMPRIIVVFDEYQMLFGETSSVSRKASLLLNQLARQSRSSGIHLILGSQSKVDEIDPTTYEQFTTRILLQASESLAGQILSPDNARRANELTHSGQVIYNEKKGIGSEKNPVGQVAMISREEVIQNVQRLKEFSQQKGFKSSSPMTVFRGDQPSSFSANKHAIQLYGSSQWPTPPQAKQYLGLKDWVASEHPALAWLGEPIEIKMHTAAAFRNRSRSNLLIVGSQEETIFGMLSSCLMSLPLFFKPSEVQFLIADLSLKDEEWADTCEHFRDAFMSYDVKVEEKGASKIIEYAHKIMLRRKQAMEDGRAEIMPSIFLLVAGLQRVSQLKPVISEYGDLKKSPLAAQLIELLDAGPELGIHSILWVDNTRNFDKILEKSALNHFSQRVTLHLSESESQFLLDDIAAAGLKGYRALFFDEDAEHPLEKFKPYAMPHSGAERSRLLNVFGQRINSRSK